MAGEHVPIRTCVGCRGRFPKKDLARFAATPADILVFDRTGKQPGRGAYLCVRKKCLRLALGRKSFHRTLRRQLVVPDDSFLWEQVRGRLLD